VNALLYLYQKLAVIRLRTYVLCRTHIVFCGLCKSIFKEFAKS
jgi:hypothetical protein